MKCGQKTCEAEAVTAFLWPGDRWLPSCQYHANVAQNVGAVMGVHVPTCEDNLASIEQEAATQVIGHVKSHEQSGE